MTNSFLRVLSLSSLTSSPLSMSSATSFAAFTNEKTTLATSSALFLLFMPPVVLTRLSLSFPLEPNEKVSPFWEGFSIPDSLDSAVVGCWKGKARRPLLRMIDPSTFDRMRVDWTPGLAARRERLSKVDADYCSAISSIHKSEQEASSYQRTESWTIASLYRQC